MQKRRHTIAAAIADQPGLEECREAERQSESSSRTMWWLQELGPVAEEKRGGCLTRGLGNEAGSGESSPWTHRLEAGSRGRGWDGEETVWQAQA